jgi:hypothetical protein
MFRTTFCLTSLFVVCLVCEPAFSQKRMMPGYILTLKGDTVKGFVDYGNWNEGPKSILFRNEAGQDATYRPLEIQGFGVNQEIYAGSIVNFVMGSNEIGKLSSDPKISLGKDTVFIQCLVRGNKSLYFSKRNGTSQFYIKVDSDYQLLEYKRYLKKLNGKDQLAENPRYISQLAGYLSDCSTIQNALKKVGYSRKKIENLFTTYNSCVGSASTYQRPKDKRIVDFGVLAGTSLTSLNFETSVSAFDLQVLQGSSYSQSVNFSGGLFLDLRQSRNFGRWSFNNELLYSTYGFKTTFASAFGPIKTEIGYSYLKLNNMIRYRFFSEKVTTFVNLGISNGYALSETNFREGFGKAVANTRKIEQSYLVGVGAAVKRFSLEIRMEKGNGMSDISNLSSATTRFYFLVGYKF